MSQDVEPQEIPSLKEADFFAIQLDGQLTSLEKLNS
jgi:hypothetical protein